MSKINFVPEISKARFFLNNLERQLLENLKPEIRGLIGVRFSIKGRKFETQIAIDCKSDLIAKNPALNLNLGEVENPYTVTEELKRILAPYLIPNKPIHTQVVKAGKRKEPRVIIDLNPMLALVGVLEDPKEGFHYEITGVVNHKNNSELEISMMRNRPVKNNNNNFVRR